MGLGRTGVTHRRPLIGPLACLSDMGRPQVTSKSFNFAAKRKLPFFFVSASDGTNVVKIFNMAIMAGIKWKASPKDDFYQEVGAADMPQQFRGGRGPWGSSLARHLETRNAPTLWDPPVLSSRCWTCWARSRWSRASSWRTRWLPTRRRRTRRRRRRLLGRPRPRNTMPGAGLECQEQQELAWRVWGVGWGGRYGVGDEAGKAFTVWPSFVPECN